MALIAATSGVKVGVRSRGLVIAAASMTLPVLFSSTTESTRTLGFGEEGRAEQSKGKDMESLLAKELSGLGSVVQKRHQYTT